MRSVWLAGKVILLLLTCSGLAASDSLELRSGRHLQGKYIGGTATIVGFMTGSAIEYFATSDVLAIIFDRNLDSPMSGVRPDPMKDVSPPSARSGNRNLSRARSRARADTTTPRLERTSARDSSASE